MTKDELLRRIEKMSIAEEQAMPVYAKHIDAIMSWSGLPQEQRGAVRDMLMTLKAESQGHLRELSKLHGYVSGSGKDVF